MDYITRISELSNQTLKIVDHCKLIPYIYLVNSCVGLSCLNIEDLNIEVMPSRTYNPVESNVKNRIKIRIVEKQFIEIDSRA